MRKDFCMLLALLSTTFISFGQQTNKSQVEGQTSFYAEGGGPGIMFSANYDRRFHQSNLGIGGRIGLGFVTTYDNYYDTGQSYFYNGRQRSIVTVPIQINYIFGKSNSPHTFEVGGGFTYLSRKVDIFNYNNNERTNLFGTFSFMYRRQPRNGGFSWRAGFTPLIANEYIQPSAGVSIGYNF